MASLLLKRRDPILTKMVNFHSLLRAVGSSFSSSSFVDHRAKQSSSCNNGNKGIASRSDMSGFRLSPLFADGRACLENCKIELVDAETWHISSGLAEAWKGRNGELETSNASLKPVDENINVLKDDSGFVDIDDMRVRGDLFYKLDRDSKEYEEYNFDFHRKKNWEKNKIDQSKSETKKSINASKQTQEQKETKKKENPGTSSDFKGEYLTPSNYKVGSFGIEKKMRTPTFNQLTAPYHEPFCLDIYISKGSVRACIVHRATSKVVAVAHSISKDMKFDLPSKKNAATCAAVGEMLAQRALADDIHNVVYTPRKGDKVEGKLQIVLQSIIDNGIDVKVKIKQRKAKKVGYFLSK